MTTFLEASLAPSSEKISLVTCEAVSPVKIFTLHSGSIYKKTVDHFVSGVLESGQKLTEKNSIESMALGSWYYHATEKTVYVFTSTGEDPKKRSLSLVYRFFFSNTPVILPYDLQGGVDVEWLPIIRNIGSIGQRLDDENVGIVLESQSSIDMINQGFFDSIFDSILWENQSVVLYSWFGGLPLSEAKRIFTGVIESKSYAPDKITFKIKDFVYRLRNLVNLELFTEDDGDLLESIIGTPKRRIYGQVKQAKCIPLDCTLTGYPLTGTISLTIGSDIMTGVGTLFLKELNQDDEIVFVLDGEEILYSVDLITDNNNLKLSKLSEHQVTDIQVKVDSEYPYRFKNRFWHVAGHKIRETKAEILDVINERTFKVDSFSEFSSGDVVRVEPAGVTTQVTRISGDQIILEQSIFPTPIIGHTISRFPINRLYYGERELVPFRDFTLINDDEAIIEISPLAEFNIAREVVSDNKLSFKLNDYEVTSSSGSDLRTIVKPGDWIRPIIQSDTTFYEVHHVGPQVIYLKEKYSDSGGNKNEIARIKKTEVIKDDSLLTVDCYGRDVGNKWLKTASDCVKDLVTGDAGFTDIDEESFSQANSDCSYTISLVFPGVGEKAPLIRDVISQINDSVFGSLYSNNQQQIAYSIVNSRKPATMEAIRDDDILSWSVESSQKIASNVQVNYLHAVDKVTGEDGFSVVSFENSFVRDNIGINNTIEKNCYLFKESDAATIAQRIAFYNSLSRSVLTIKAKSGFFSSSVNDRIYVDLERLYNRYGGSSTLKVGVISGIKKGPYNTEVEMNDLGNIFNRCPSISPDEIPSFTNASDDEKIKFGYIVDDDTKIPGDNEDDFGSNLLG